VGKSGDGREWWSYGAYGGVYNDSKQDLVGASSVVAVQPVVAAKSSDAGGGGNIAADVIKTKKPGSPQQEEGVVGVAPEKAVKKNAASGEVHDAPGAEHASSGRMKPGGQNFGVGESGGPTEPTAASTTTED